MSYDCNGLRTQKGNIHYYYDSDNNLIAMVNGSNTLFFYYDESGSVTSFSLGGSMYFYVKNLQGDIINIADSNGTFLVRYDYDVFGKIVNITDYSDPNVTGVQDFALINPLRYRGYVYDDETGLYYLQSRYYDSVTGRFLNADSYTDTESGSPLSTNMFAYCENNYLYQSDPTGYKAKGAVFETSNRLNFNCYAYALGDYSEYLSPGNRGYSDETLENIKLNTYYYHHLISIPENRVKNGCSINKLLVEVMRDLSNMHIEWRIANKSTKLNNGEYLIAMRVCTMSFHDKTRGDAGIVSFKSYHFMKQDPYTKEWWHKDGSNYIQNKGKINPDLRTSWYKYSDNDYKHKCKIYANGKYNYVYYNSVTKYLAIKKQFTRVKYGEY